MDLFRQRHSMDLFSQGHSMDLFSQRHSMDLFSQRHNMDLFRFTRQNLTPLQKLENAVKQNDFEELEELLNQGIDPNTALTKHWGDTALHIAACRGNFKCIEILLAHGANAETLNDDGISPLFDAICLNHQRSALELLYKVDYFKSIEDVAVG